MGFVVARQPIFDRSGEVFAYELLFRSSLSGVLGSIDGNTASAEVLSNAFLNLGVEDLTGGKSIFVNFTHDLLVQGIPTLFPQEKLVVEVLEDVDPTQEVLVACSELKAAGYRIAIDDYIGEGPWRDHLDVPDVIKVDLLDSAPGVWQRLAGERPPGTALLAEKVESMDVYKEALSLGYDYFQGHFFCRPQVVAGEEIPGLKLNHLQLIQKVNTPPFDLKEIEATIARDPALSYQLLRLINSAMFGLRNEVESLHAALVMLGEREVRRWVTLVSMAGMLTDRPGEVLVQSLVRGRFLELLAEPLGLDERFLDLYLLGMFSTLDALLDRPMEEVVNQIPLMDDIRGALLGEPGRLGDALRLVLSYERADWPAFDKAHDKLGLDAGLCPRLYGDAVEWVEKMSINEPVESA